MKARVERYQRWRAMVAENPKLFKIRHEIFANGYKPQLLQRSGSFWLCIDYLPTWHFNGSGNFEQDTEFEIPKGCAVD